MGMTYSLSFDAMLTAYLAFGMLGDMDEESMQSPYLLLDAITKCSDKVVVFCNKGGIAVPPSIRKVYSLMEKTSSKCLTSIISRQISILSFG